jgi:hypothetical protein
MSSLSMVAALVRSVHDAARHFDEELCRGELKVLAAECELLATQTQPILRSDLDRRQTIAAQRDRQKIGT